jgi:peptidoglycan/xylan/chitin deacetylase (PgdA/CDA1 family)
MTHYEDAKCFERSVKLVRDGGFELALHAYQGSHLSAEALKSELDVFRGAVGSPPRGVRYHILKFRPPDTWEFQSQLGLEYDATFGYNRFFGFRGGSCFPYHPFSPTGRLSILELPTGFMDFTALHRNPDGSRFGEFLQMAKERVEEFHGALVVNFHNTYLNAETFPSVVREYESFLGKIREQGYWVATAAECAEWWRFRSSHKVNPRLSERGEILLEGSGVPVYTFEESDMGGLRHMDNENTERVDVSA